MKYSYSVLPNDKMAELEKFIMTHNNNNNNNNMRFVFQYGTKFFMYKKGETYPLSWSWANAWAHDCITGTAADVMKKLSMLKDTGTTQSKVQRWILNWRLEQGV